MGYGEVVCRPDGEWLRFYGSTGNRTIAMMNWSRRTG